MSADNQLGKGSPEQKEWEGQKWEYLDIDVVSGVADGYIKVRERYGGIFGHPKKNALIEKYNEKIRRAREQNKGGSIADDLNILGQDGWEVATSNVANPNINWSILILKRPIPRQK